MRSYCERLKFIGRIRKYLILFALICSFLHNRLGTTFSPNPGSVMPVAERVCPLHEEAEAFGHLIEDRPSGKVVLDVTTRATQCLRSSAP